MKRGFKAEAERISTQIRKDMGFDDLTRVDAEQIAKHLDVEVRSASSLIDIAKLEAIDRAQPGAFSACTFEIGDRRIIVWNPLSPASRVQSDIAHEVAHLLLKHDVKQVQRIGEFSFFACEPEEEQEATWLAGCLLLPRALLAKAAFRHMSADAIANAHGVSLQMANFRLRTTGVLQQAGRR